MHLVPQSASRGFGVGTGVRGVEEDSRMRADNSDILTDMAPRPHFFCLPHFEENDPRRKSHPFTEGSGRQDPLLYF